MKYYKYLPIIVGCAGLIFLLLTFLNIGSIVNIGTAFCLFIVGIVLSMFFVVKGWSGNTFAGWLGLLINLIPSCLLGFVYLNTTFGK
jgi:hypothetical protein